MKRLFWFLAIIALGAYSFMVWSWWDEGNRERASASNCTEYTEYSFELIDRIPQSCLRAWIEVNHK